MSLTSLSPVQSYAGILTYSPLHSAGHDIGDARAHTYTAFGGKGSLLLLAVFEAQR